LKPFLGTNVALGTGRERAVLITAGAIAVDAVLDLVSVGASWG
jgi:hypothetical protein